MPNLQILECEAVQDSLQTSILGSNKLLQNHFLHCVIFVLRLQKITLNQTTMQDTERLKCFPVVI